MVGTARCATFLPLPEKPTELLHHKNKALCCPVPLKWLRTDKLEHKRAAPLMIDFRVHAEKGAYGNTAF